MLPQIIRKFGTPFHIYDEAGIRGTLQELKRAFTDNGLDFREFYAVKALPKPAIMDIIHDEGCAYDCSSVTELRLARAAGARRQDIMFTSNNTSDEEFAEALAHGGSIVNLDDEVFLDHPLIKNGPRDMFCCRLNPGKRKTDDEVNEIIGDPVNSKYGVPIEHIVHVYARAKEMGFRQFGIHTMVCSNDLNYVHMLNTLKLELEVASGLNRHLGIRPALINMGGGIGIPYRAEESPFDIDKFACGCRELVAQFAHDNHYVPKLFLESGRYVTGPHGVLVNRVINRYRKYKEFAGVESGMTANMRVAIYSTAYHHGPILKSDGVPVGPADRLVEKITVAGSICENCDVLARDMPLPNPQVGDLYLTHDDGAHSSAMPGNYNGRCRPQELLLCGDGTVRRICRAETYEDLERRHRDLEGDEHVLEVQDTTAAADV